MNRYRLNQILEVLLFPVTDFRFGQKDQDKLLQCYRAYCQFQKANASRTMGSVRQNNAKSEYIRCRNELVVYLEKRCRGKVKSEDDILMLLERYYPMKEVDEEITAIEKQQLAEGHDCSNEDNISIYYLKKLSSIASSLITYRDGFAAIRQWVDEDNTNGKDVFRSNSVYNKVEIWTLLCRMTVPDLYIAIAAVDNQLGLEALYEQKSYIALADKLLDKVLQKGLAENHMHFNVGLDYEAIWLWYTDLDFLENTSIKTLKTKEFRERFGVALFRALAACYVENGNYRYGFERWIKQCSPDDDSNLVCAMLGGKDIQDIPDDEMKRMIRRCCCLIPDDAVREADYLMGRVYAQYLEYKVSSEFIFLYQCYRYIVNNSVDTFFARRFLQYIRFKNEYFYKGQERYELQGLKFFQKKYGCMKSMVQDVVQKSDGMLEIFRFQAKINGLKKMEVRVAPKVGEDEVQEVNSERAVQILMPELYKQTYMILNVYRRYILESMIGVQKTSNLLKKERNRKNIARDIEGIVRELGGVQGISVPSLGIVFHFTKTEQVEGTMDVYCWRYVREHGRKVMPLRMGTRRLITNVAVALERIRETVPGLDEYLVGIDAASDENAMEPWMFAQAYQIMRSHMYTKPIFNDTNGREKFHKIQNIGFTYHVGEDFRHIVSGFRHIDEVLEEFGYKAGDRLGHALALGIDVEQWVANNEVVPIPKLEHLENLLWMWGVNTCDGFNLSVRLELLENKIMDIVQSIFPNPHTITVKMLYQAYKRKFGVDHAQSAAKLNKKGDSQQESSRGTNEKCSECQEVFCDRWDQEKLLMTNYCPLFIQKYEQVELVPVTKDEIEAYQRLQEYLIRKVEEKGIYLEVNPTSNLTIGDFSQINRHPIFKLSHIHESDKKHVMVTINSDDPAVFNTNIENEFAYIYYAAEELGYSKSEILEWIDRIRQQGLDASFVKYEKNAAQILAEIQQMMDFIKKNFG